MRIVFGQNNFLIQCFNPYELGLTKDSKSDYTIEVRQNYVHFFWIPFFGTGKSWMVRKASGLYEMPNDFKEIIAAKNVRVSSPWYTFSGIIMLLLVCIGYYAGEKYRNYQSYQNDVLWIEQKAHKINNPEINDKYLLIIDGGSFTMTVEEIKGDSLFFDVPIATNVNSHYKTNKNQHDESVFVGLTKKELLSCCVKTPEDFNVFRGQRIKNLNFLSDKKFYLDRVDRQ
jgi:hypothetical protein